jgi:hypothetical protein
MDRIIYVVQPFSRNLDGSLAWDPPAWSQDRSFAASLTRVLSQSKAGVMTIGAGFDQSGAVAPEGQIVASHGCLPTSLLLPRHLTGGHATALGEKGREEDLRRTA